MKPFDIFIVYLSWGSAGKSRPVLVLAVYDEYVKIYRITTQYENKGRAIRSKYFEILDWKQAGLDKQSYIDTNDTFELSRSAIAGKKVIGNLTENDKLRLLEFLAQ
jgi:hypothetical protein